MHRKVRQLHSRIRKPKHRASRTAAECRLSAETAVSAENANYQQGQQYQQNANYQQRQQYQQNTNYQQGQQYQQNTNYQQNMNYQQGNMRGSREAEWAREKGTEALGSAKTFLGAAGSVLKRPVSEAVRMSGDLHWQKWTSLYHCKSNIYNHYCFDPVYGNCRENRICFQWILQFL